MTLRYFLESRDGDGAWDYLCRIAKERGEKEMHRILRNTVVVYYPMMVGEFFEIEGLMAWGPGHRVWASDEMLPDLKGHEAIKKLKFFVIYELANLPISYAVKNLIEKYEDPEQQCVEVRMLRYVFSCVGRDKMHELVLYMYNRIAKTRTSYELGGARPYLSYYFDTGDAMVAISGFVLLLTRGLDKKQVREERLAMVRFGQGQRFYTNLDVTKECSGKALMPQG